jgi:hypothetical protein
MTTPPGPLGQYLDQLRASLRTPDARLILAEAEDHLREAVAAGRAAGLTEREAQEAAISSFGSVRAVVRAHQAGRGRAAAVMGDLALAVCKLTGLVLLAYDASILIAYLIARPGAPAAGLPVAPPAGGHDAWIAANIAAGIVGLPLLAGYYLARRVQRGRRGARGVPSTRSFPLLAVIWFGAAAAGLIAAKISGSVPVHGPTIVVFLALTAASAVWTGRARLRRKHGQGPSLT